MIASSRGVLPLTAGWLLRLKSWQYYTRRQWRKPIPMGCNNSCLVLTGLLLGVFFKITWLVHINDRVWCREDPNNVTPSGLVSSYVHISIILSSLRDCFQAWKADIIVVKKIAAKLTPKVCNDCFVPRSFTINRRIAFKPGRLTIL